jgi:hypothetical protein
MKLSLIYFICSCYITIWLEPSNRLTKLHKAMQSRISESFIKNIESQSVRNTDPYR